MVNEESLLVLVVSTSSRGEKITEPLSTTDISFEYFQFGDGNRARDLFKTVQTKKPDLIISDSVAFAGGVVMISSITFSIPYVIRLRGDALCEERLLARMHLSNNNVKKTFAQIPRQFLTVVSLWASESIFPVSNYLNNRYESFNSSRVTIPTPCFMLEKDIDQSKENDLGELDGKDHIILAVTNMNFSRKVSGLLDGLEPVSDVLEKRDDTTLLIAGDGPYLGEIEKKCGELSGKIKTLGYVPEIEELYQKADVFIHFSYLDAYPSTVLEAYANKVPVIANDAVGMSEQIKDGETGYLVDLDSPSEVEHALERLLESKGLRQDIGEAGHNQVRNQNDPAMIGRELRSSIMSLFR